MVTRVSYFSTLRETSEPPPKSMLYPTSSRSSPLRGSLRSEDFSSEPSTSTNISPLISTDSYAILFSSIFTMCNTTQRGQLWIVVNFPAYNPNKSALVITAVITSWHMQIMRLQVSRPYPYISIPITQLSINGPPFWRRKDPNSD